eukprot:12292632-Alexandrium_andersonii.AAC.1
MPSPPPKPPANRAKAMTTPSPSSQPAADRAKATTPPPQSKPPANRAKAAGPPLKVQLVPKSVPPKQPTTAGSSALTGQHGPAKRKVAPASQAAAAPPKKACRPDATVAVAASPSPTLSIRSESADRPPRAKNAPPPAVPMTPQQHAAAPVTPVGQAMPGC